MKQAPVTGQTWRLRSDPSIARTIGTVENDLVELKGDRWTSLDNLLEAWEPPCPGSGFDAVIDARTGFFGCAACGVALGVVLRAQHTAPEHYRGQTPPVDPGQRFTTKPEHRGTPLLMMAEASGLSKDWTIDLLLRALLVTQAEFRKHVEHTAKPASIVMCGDFDPRKNGAPS